MLVQGVMISFTPNTKVEKKGGGTYDAWELVYRNKDNKVESIVKPATGLKFNPSLKAGLQGLNPNDEFTVVMEKENGYWTPQSVQRGYSDVQDVGQASSPKADGNRAEAVGPRSGKVVGSNYETPEERAKKQVVIVRQAMLNAAIATLSSAKAAVDPDKAIDLATQYEAYVYQGLDLKAKEYKAVAVE